MHHQLIINNIYNKGSKSCTKFYLYIYIKTTKHLLFLFFLIKRDLYVNLKYTTFSKKKLMFYFLYNASLTICLKLDKIY